MSVVRFVLQFGVKRKCVWFLGSVTCFDFDCPRTSRRSGSVRRCHFETSRSCGGGRRFDLEASLEDFNAQLRNERTSSHDRLFSDLTFVENKTRPAPQGTSKVNLVLRFLVRTYNNRRLIRLLRPVFCLHCC